LYATRGERLRELQIVYSGKGHIERIWHSSFGLVEPWVSEALRVVTTRGIPLDSLKKTKAPNQTFLFRRVDQNHLQYFPHSHPHGHTYTPSKRMVCKTQGCSSPELIPKVRDGDEKVPSYAGVKCPLPPRRKVRFSEGRNETYETYSIDEVQESWYTRSDYKAIQREIRSTSQRIHWGIPLDENRHCNRGLQHDLNVFQDSHKAQSIARTYVLEAQIQGKDAEEIGFYYAIHTRIRSIKAYLQGVEDEKHCTIVGVS